jgi:hypothetical protein
MVKELVENQRVVQAGRQVILEKKVKIMSMLHGKEASGESASCSG